MSIACWSEILYGNTMAQFTSHQYEMCGNRCSNQGRQPEPSLSQFNSSRYKSCDQSVCDDELDDDFTFSTVTYFKGIFFILFISTLTIMIYKVSMSYTKSYEIMSVMVLLLLTLVIFEPPYFFPAWVVNSVHK
ncbi:unnamed protein product [Lymnaea stagnalis]|uniref:Uncharacterized protein n=1 Tax=Lymnaea stagnalis TaxID=6523 RepID=A0AAV2HEN5_LYMST